ncbi:MAG TPA: hypothetical protein VG013_26250, partial [Gemmataceae bacterium]|nr:hypothetical protein [Gemmataceae bacterium]
PRKQCSMKMHILVLRGLNTVMEILQADGWTVVIEGKDRVRARHPAVPDEVTARSRLQHLGLLTSGALRICFTPRP